MSVIVSKRKGVIYHSKGMRVEELLTDMSFDSQSIDIQSSFIYLGINVHQGTWLRKSAEHTLSCPIEGPDRFLGKPSLFFVFMDLDPRSTDLRIYLDHVRASQKHRPGSQ